MPYDIVGEMGEGVSLSEVYNRTVISKTLTREVNHVKRKIVNDVVL